MPCAIANVKFFSVPLCLCGYLSFVDFYAPYLSSGPSWWTFFEK
jgi:hypothetical protein